MKLRTLGGLSLLGAHFTQPKPLVLLSYLALEGPQERAHLAELFWPGGESRKSLSMTLTRLRQAAGEVVQTDEGRVWTSLENDAGTLLAALARSDWREAVRLYRGAFLQGVALGWSAELEEWVYTTREFLAERVQHALLALAEGEARAGNFSETLRFAEHAYRLPGAPPADVGTLERTYRLLVAGESVLAPKVRKELEEYGPATNLKSAAARAEFNPTPNPLGRALPLRATSFVGRDVELLELGHILGQPGCRLLTLLGSAGIGKTRLALQFAAEQQRAGSYEGGVYFVALEAERESTFLSHIAQALGGTLTTQADPLEALEALLGSKRLLVVLDNFEQLSAAAPGLAQLLRRCPNLELLVTSRVRLGLDEEYLFALEGLGFPQKPVVPPDAAAFGAVQLFTQRARQLRPDFEVARELPAVLELCACLSGSPLGLELAAGWVRFMSCADIVRELRQSLDFLTSSALGVPERQRSLRAAFDYSWGLLSPKEQETLAALSVFRGGFTREAASQAVGATIPLLASLLDKSLLQLPSGSRFELRPLIAYYASEKLRETPERWKARRADHAAYFMRVAREQDAAVQAGRQHEALRVLTVEWANIQTGFEYKLESHDLADLERCPELLELLHDTRGSYAEALAFLDRAEGLLAAQVPSAHALLGSARVERAWFELRLGRYDNARASVLSALENLPRTSLRRVSALNILGILERRSGHYARAKEACFTGLTLARRHGDELLIAKLLASLADIEEALGDHATAERYFLDAIALYRKHGRVLGVTIHLNNLGWLYYLEGRLDEAKTAFEEGLRLARDIDFRQTLPYLLNNLGYIALAHGQVAEAQRLNEEALTLAQQNGERAVQAEILTSLGRVAAASGRPKEALRYLDDGLRLAWEVAYIGLILQALLTRGELLQRTGEPYEAAKLAFFVREHPAATDVETSGARALLKLLEATLGPERCAQAEAFGKEARLEELVEGLLERAPHPSSHA